MVGDFGASAATERGGLRGKTESTIRSASLLLPGLPRAARSAIGSLHEPGKNKNHNEGKEQGRGEVVLVCAPLFLHPPCLSPLAPVPRLCLQPRQQAPAATPRAGMTASNTGRCNERQPQPQQGASAGGPEGMAPVFWARVEGPTLSRACPLPAQTRRWPAGAQRSEKMALEVGPNFFYVTT